MSIEFELHSISVQTEYSFQIVTKYTLREHLLNQL
jgi:hypothetical protein